MSWVRPNGTRNGREAYQLRFLTGAILLAVLVSVLALAIASANGQWRGAAVIGAYLVLILLQAVAVRLGASIGVVAWTILSTVGILLLANAILPHANQAGQLYWFLLIPLSVRALAAPRPDAPDERHSWRTEGVSSAIAMAAVILVVTYHVSQPGPVEGGRSGIGFDIGLDVGLFLLSSLGLLYIHELSVRETTRELRRLQKLLSICAWCRTIKHNDQWVQLEDYISEQQGLEVTHGMCPACFKNFTGKQK